MSDLRKKLIRIAHENPNLRPVLLPLLKEGMEHPTEDAMKRYLDEHPKAQPKNHRVKGEGDGAAKEDEGGTTTKAPEKAAPTPKPKKVDEGIKVLTVKDVPEGGSATGTPMSLDNIGDPPAEYETLTGKGSKKLYSDATSDLKGTQKAAKKAAYDVAFTQLQAEGLSETEAASKARKISKKVGKQEMWDAFDKKYLPEFGNPAVHAHQMAQTLGKYADNSVEYDTVSDKPLKKGSTAALSTVRENADKVIEKYKKALPSEYKQEALRAASDMVMDAVEGALKDGSLGDITESEMNGMLISTLEQLVYQDVESAKRVLSDHGTRHVVSNMAGMQDIFKALKGAGKGLTGAEQLGALFVMAHHDIGYTTAASGGAPAGDVLMKAHPRFSRALVEGNPFWKKAFGDKAEPLLGAMTSHSEAATDWENHPIESAIRLTDNTSCFADEKLPDMLALDKETPEIMAKMMMLQKAGGPRRFGETKWDSEEDAQAFEDLREQLIARVDDLDINEDIKGPLRESLHKDMSPHSPEFLLSMFGGKKTGFETEKGPDGKMRVVVKVKATPERQVLDSLFGDTADFQTGRMLDEYDIQAPSPDNVELHNLPSMSGVDDNAKMVTSGPKSGVRFQFEGADTADTGFLEGIKGVGGSTIRMDLQKFAREASRLDPKKRKALGEKLLTSIKGKMDDSEYKALQAHLDTDHSDKLGDGEHIGDATTWAREILRFPMTKKERELLGLKTGKAAATIKKVPVDELKDDAENTLQVSVGKHWNHGSVSWVEPEFLKCPAVQQFERVFGRMNPSPPTVKKEEQFEKLIYDFGAVACRAHRKKCPYWKGLSSDEKWTLCAYKPEPKN